MNTLPTQEQLASLAGIVASANPDFTPEKCVCLALDLWDQAGECIETIKGHEEAAQRGPYAKLAGTFLCPDCNKPMTKTAPDSWCCYSCRQVWSLIPKGLNPGEPTEGGKDVSGCDV